MALKSAVEKVAGFKLKGTKDFTSMVDFIEMETRAHISETTLQRLWGYSTRGRDVVSEHTLDVLSKVVGSADWEDFCKNLKASSGEESTIFSGDTIDSRDLEVGARLRIGWLPDRLCEIRYLGDNRFIAEACQNCKMQVGDTFSALQFQKGRELYLDHFVRGGSVGAVDAGCADGGAGDVAPIESRYVVGEDHGLTTLEVL